MHLRKIAEGQPDKLAVVMADGSASLTFAELDQRSTALADRLAHEGLRVGDHVAIMMGNTVEYFIAAWAAQRSGLLYTPVNWHLTAGEAAFIIDDCGAQALIADAALAATAGPARVACGGVRVAFAVGGEIDGFFSYDEVINTAPIGGREEEIEGCYFLYSSGTTGQPKGIQQPHTFAPFGTGLRLDSALPSGFGVTGQTVYLCPAPLYHAAPLGWSLGVQRHGGTVVLMETFDAVAALEAIERFGVTHGQFVPTMFVRMLKLPDAQRAAFDVSSLAMVVHAGAPCPIPVKDAMITWLGPVLFEYYAGSEGGGMTTITSQEWLTHRGSVGRASYGTIHIVDAAGAEAAPGEVGGIFFGDTEKFSYHNDEAKTLAARDDRGWHTLGDLGLLDAEGYLYLSDRRSDLIISGGVNIYPQEVESALVMHPDVDDVAVIGVSDDEMGQSVHAVVQPAPGSEPTTALAEDLLSFARQQLAAFKCPRTLAFTAELPRTATGKLLRRKLRAQAGVVAP